MAETYSAGIVTAYGAAVRGGYIGTYEQWCQDMANLGDNVAEVRTKAAQAAQSEGNAAGSATAAAGSAGSAAGSASEAASSAGNAAGSEAAAAESATAAAGSATAASASATAAGNAQTAAETAQGKAEDAQEAAETAAQSVSQSAAQISQNTSDISDLKSAVKKKAPAIYDTASGAIASFEDGADGMPLHKLTVQIEPVQARSGDPSPDNVRPISGWTGANVTRTGKNLFNKDAVTVGKWLNVSTGEEETASSNAFVLSDWIPVKSGITYHITYTQSSRNWLYNSSKEPLAIISSEAISGAITFTPTEDGFARFTVNTSAAQLNTIQFEIGSTATAYEPYQGNTYAITWQSEAGTVYGGTLDVTTGVLTVTMGIIDLSALSWNIKGSVDDYSTFTTASPVQYSTFNPHHMIAEQFIYGGFNGSSNNVFAGLASHHDYIYVYWENGATSYYLYANANTAAKPQGKFAVELKNPIIYQLTPIEVKTLHGTNNIWADCGPVSVDYPADTKLYIQKVNKPTDDDMTADTQIASGKYFIIGNTLYLSTTVIPAGDTIIPGTNCTKTDLAEALNALNT